MVAHLKKLSSKASELSERESHTHTVPLSTDSQITGQNDGRCLAPLDVSVAQVSQDNDTLAQPATVPTAAQSISALNFEPQSVRPRRPIGVAMPKQPRLFFDLPDRSEVKEPLLPERTKASFYEILKPIAGKNSFRSIAQLKRSSPVLVCIQRIDEAKKLSGLSNKQIGELVDLDRNTVAKILKCEPGIGFYEFCAVMNVLGLEIAELFPMRKREPAPQIKFPRGYIDVEVARKPDVMARMVKTKRFGDYLRRRKRWG